MEQEIPVFKPLLEAEEFEASRKALELGWLGMGSYVGAFEKALREMIQARDRHVVAVSTGHAALHLGLLIAGVGPGDEVITPSFNNICDFQAIAACGARPVFCDIDPKTLCLNLDQVPGLISPRTRALISMDYFCHVCDHDGVADLARRYNLRVIHDAAHSLGSTYRGKPIGSFHDICMFSLDPIKTFTCIDGGALVVRTEEEKLALQEMRIIGQGQRASTLYANERSWTYDVTRLGFRYHLANPHAAIGLEQLAKRDVIGASRRAACRRYNERLRGVEGVAVPPTDFEGVTPFCYYVRVPEGARDPLRDYLAGQGIGTGIHWQPGHWFTLFKDCRRADLSVTEKVGRQVLSLPLHSKMAPATVDRVADAIASFFAKVWRKAS